MTQRTPYGKQGVPIMQGTRRTVQRQQPAGIWDEDLDEAVVQPAYRIARASLPAQEQRRRQLPPHQGASHHYVGTSCAIHPEDPPYLTDEEADGGLVPARVPARATAAIDEGLDERPARTSARRYRSTMTTEQHPAPATRRRGRSSHTLVFIGLVLLCMLVGFVLISALTAWWQQTADYLHYGMPRTFQMDAVVGHQDSAAHPSHFLAVNLGGHLSVIEIPSGDVSKMVVYSGPVIYGQNADLVAVTLSVVHDQHGQPELVLHYQNNEVILYNGRDGKFHLQPQG
jgi:hypothetical protein